MFHDLKIWLCSCKARFHVTIAGNGESLTAVEDFAAFVLQSLDRMLDHVDRIPIDKRSHHCFAIQRIPNWQTLVGSQKSIPNFRRDRFVHDHASRGSATLSGSADCTEEDRSGSHVDVGAGRDDERVIAAEFHDCSGEAAMNGLRNIKAHVDRAGG